MPQGRLSERRGAGQARAVHTRQKSGVFLRNTDQHVHGASARRTDRDAMGGRGLRRADNKSEPHREQAPRRSQTCRNRKHSENGFVRPHNPTFSRARRDIESAQKTRLAVCNQQPFRRKGGQPHVSGVVPQSSETARDKALRFSRASSHVRNAASRKRRRRQNDKRTSGARERDRHPQQVRSHEPRQQIPRSKRAD